MYYNMPQDRLPAPYELNSAPPPNSQSPQYLARGGHASKHKKMTLVHMNPHELSLLDHLQGGSEYGHGGIKAYSHLEELLKNPHIVESIHRHAHHHRQHHAYGGPSQQNMAALGRHGDSELAMIGPHTHGLFNQIAGYPTRNPYTGHPEYFSIGGALSGLWNTIKGAVPTVTNAIKGILPHAKGIAQAAAPALMPIAQQALGKKYGDIGDVAGSIMSHGVQGYLGKPGEDADPYHTAIGQGIGTAAQQYAGGANRAQAFGHGLNEFGSKIGGGIGNALAASGQALGQGQGFREASRTGAQRGFNELGGRQGIYNAVGNIAQGLGQGGWQGAQEAGRQQMNQYVQRAMPRPANQTYLPPHEENPYEGIAQMYG